MHGEGRFKHEQNIVIDSVFCNNLAMIDGGHFVNPFMTEVKRQDYLERIAISIADEIRAESAKLDKITVHKAHDADQLRAIISQVRSNNRTPLVVSTNENPISYQELMVVVDPDYSEFNLRSLTLDMDRELWP